MHHNGIDYLVGLLEYSAEPGWSRRPHGWGRESRVWNRGRDANGVSYCVPFL